MCYYVTVKILPLYVANAFLLFSITHISPEEILRFQNMQQTKKLDDMPHQSSQGFGKNLDNAKLPGVYEVRFKWQ